MLMMLLVMLVMPMFFIIVTASPCPGVAREDDLTSWGFVAERGLEPDRKFVDRPRGA
jgi:hypothetical protein